VDIFIFEVCNVDLVLLMEVPRQINTRMICRECSVYLADDEIPDDEIPDDEIADAANG